MRSKSETQARDNQSSLVHLFTIENHCHNCESTRPLGMEGLKRTFLEKCSKKYMRSATNHF